MIRKSNCRSLSVELWLDRKLPDCRSEAFRETQTFGRSLTPTTVKATLDGPTGSSETGVILGAEIKVEASCLSKTAFPKVEKDSKCRCVTSIALKVGEAARCRCVASIALKAGEAARCRCAASIILMVGEAARCRCAASITLKVGEAARCRCAASIILMVGEAAKCRLTVAIASAT